MKAIRHALLLPLGRALSCGRAWLGLKSVHSIWFTLGLVIIQLICFRRALIKLHKFSWQTWQPYARPNFELGLYVVALTVNVLLLPVLIWSSLCTIGLSSNDNFKFGVDLDTGKMSRKLLGAAKRVKKTGESDADKMSKSHYSIFNSLIEGSNAKKSGSNYDLNSRKSKRLSSFSMLSSDRLAKFFNSDKSEEHFIPKRDRQRRSTFQHFKIVLKSLCSFLEVKHLKENFVPLSSLIHFICALCFLLPNVLLIAREIQFGLRPKGHVHHSELDFLFTRPYQQDTSGVDNSKLAHKSLMQLIYNRPSSLNASLNANKSVTTQTERQLPSIKYQLLSSLLESTSEINYQAYVSIELFNFILALISFSINYASCLWTVNKAYAFIFSVHLMLSSWTCVLFYSAFEVIYKFQLCYAKSNFQFLNNPTSLKLAFVWTFVLLVLSSVPMYSLAIMNYESGFARLHDYFLFLIYRTNHANSDRERSNRLKQQLASAVCQRTLTTDRKLDHSTNNSELDKNMNSQPQQQQQPTISGSSSGSQRAEDLLGNVDKNVGVAATSLLIASGSDSSNLNSSKSQQESSSEVSDSVTPQPTTATINTSSTSSPDSMTNLISKSYHHHSSFNNLPGLVHSDLEFIRTYKSHILALFLLILLSFNSIVILYDCVFLFKLTNDVIPFWLVIVYTLFIVWYTLLWLVLTFNKEIKAEFSQTFKLNYWHFLNKLLKDRPELNLKLILDNQRANLIHFSLNLNTPFVSGESVDEPGATVHSDCQNNEAMTAATTVDDSTTALLATRRDEQAARWDSLRKTVVRSGEERSSWRAASRIKPSTSSPSISNLLSNNLSMLNAINESRLESNHLNNSNKQSSVGDDASWASTTNHDSQLSSFNQHSLRYEGGHKKLNSMTNLPFSKRYDLADLVKHDELKKTDQPEPKRMVNSHSYVNDYVNSSMATRFNLRCPEVSKPRIPDYEYLNDDYTQQPQASFTTTVNEKKLANRPQRSVSPLIEKRKLIQPQPNSLFNQGLGFRQQPSKLKYQKPFENSAYQAKTQLNLDSGRLASSFKSKLPAASLKLNSNSDKNLIKYSAAPSERDPILFESNKNSSVAKKSPMATTTINTFYFNMNEVAVDSGRDSMSDSPLSVLQTTSASNSSSENTGESKLTTGSKMFSSSLRSKYGKQTSDYYSPKESTINESLTESFGGSLKTAVNTSSASTAGDRTTAAGAFTLKCILLSSGNSVTLEQSSHTLQQQHVQ